MSFWAYVPLQVVKRITLQRLRLLFMSFWAYMVLQVVDLEVAQCSDSLVVILFA